jgi:hypothetical protein
MTVSADELERRLRREKIKMAGDDDIVAALKRLADDLSLTADIEKRIQKIHGSKKPIPGSARIYHDLQLGGDDASELLEGISKAHGVSFQGFRFDDYFPNETEHMWLMLKARLGFPDKKRKPLTFDHLVDVGRQGHWSDPDADI